MSGKSLSESKGAVTIAYLAPALTALESTFVYDELLALERRGFQVVPVSVHRPVKPLTGHDELLARTRYLYDGGALRTLLQSLPSLWRMAGRQRRALRWLCEDLRATGVSRSQRWKLLFQYVVAAHLANLLLERGCCHLHVHFAHVPAQIAMYASAMSEVPFTVMAHANDIFERGMLLPQRQHAP